MPSYVRAGIRKCARIRALSIPPDVKHWHGAAPHEAFSHLAFMIADGTGDATNEWLEPVDPDAYGTLR